MRVVALVACAASVVSCNTEEPIRACTLIGCGWVAVLDASFVAADTELATATAQVCIGARCASGALPITTQSEMLTGPFEVRLELDDNGANMHTLFAEIIEATELTPGDTYTLSVMSTDGTTLVTRSWTASFYTRTFPNGEDCDEGCVTAELQPR